LDPEFKFALYELNSSVFLQFLENVSGIEKLLPDPYYQGGGIHQILHGGILDIHKDFNIYPRLDIFRQLNVIIYLNEQWGPAYGGELELWDAALADGGKCVKSIPQLFNRAVNSKWTKQAFTAIRKNGSRHLRSPADPSRFTTTQRASWMDSSTPP